MSDYRQALLKIIYNMAKREVKMPTDQYLEQLMHDYGDSIFRMCFLYLKDYQLAEDATQETFIKAFRNYKSFNHGSSEKTWIVRIAINCCKNIMRTHWFRTRRNSAEEFVKEASDNPTERWIEKRTISDAIMKLNISDRIVILLYYYHEFSLKDIAEIIDGNENMVNQRLYRARGRLKKILMEEGYNCEDEMSN